MPTPTVPGRSSPVAGAQRLDDPGGRAARRPRRPARSASRTSARIAPVVVDDQPERLGRADVEADAVAVIGPTPPRAAARVTAAAPGAEQPRVQIRGRPAVVRARASPTRPRRRAGRLRERGEQGPTSGRRWASRTWTTTRPGRRQGVGARRARVDGHVGGEPPRHVADRDVAGGVDADDHGAAQVGQLALDRQRPRGRRRAGRRASSGVTSAARPACGSPVDPVGGVGQPLLGQPAADARRRRRPPGPRAPAPASLSAPRQSRSAPASSESTAASGMPRPRGGARPCRGRR